MLLEMARRGEIDPWNIDVIDVTDRFLKKLEDAKNLDLRISGRVLLYAAILIRMKAETITLESVETTDEGEEDETPSFLIDDVEFDDGILEVLKSQRRRIRKITTLVDLIRELRKAEEVERRRKKRKVVERDIVKKTLVIFKEENLEDIISKVEREVLRILRSKKSISFYSLVRGKSVGKILDYYVSLLHLAFRRKVELNQREVYGDLEVKLP
ncbi:segregation/condensation protein A [Archaeoglobales archaeon]|nr:MAG: segregation/condensation protein A [Archaeoglobales archaeon]